jgi:molybdopterin synthase sulfur carrier subunit
MRAPTGYQFYMTVTVLLFASYADSLGTQSMRFDLPQGATVADVLHRVQALPGADRLPSEPLMAVNERYARGTQVLEADDEVAIIPPVAGG